MRASSSLPPNNKTSPVGQEPRLSKPSASVQCVYWPVLNQPRMGGHRAAPKLARLKVTLSSNSSCPEAHGHPNPCLSFLSTDNSVFFLSASPTQAPDIFVGFCWT